MVFTHYTLQDINFKGLARFSYEFSHPDTNISLQHLGMNPTAEAALPSPDTYYPQVCDNMSHIRTKTLKNSRKIG